MTISELERKSLVEAGRTVVANMRTDKALIAWAQKEGCYVRIDRRSPWGNPFVIPQHGDRDAVCDKHAEYLQTRPDLLKLIEAGALTGKVLGCWCWPLRCHGDHLAALANKSTD